MSELDDIDFRHMRDEEYLSDSAMAHGCDTKDQLHSDRGWLLQYIRTLTTEGEIKTRALEVACRELNNWAGYVADHDGSKMVLEDIGRTLDQCRNARHGTLSSDPWPELTAQVGQHD